MTVGAYLEITMQIPEENRTAAAKVYTDYRRPFLEQNRRSPYQRPPGAHRGRAGAARLRHRRACAGLSAKRHVPKRRVRRPQAHLERRPRGSHLPRGCLNDSSADSGAAYLLASNAPRARFQRKPELEYYCPNSGFRFGRAYMNSKENRMRKYLAPVVIGGVFAIVAVSLWLATGNAFYLLNFGYIGACLAAGLSLLIANVKGARVFVEFAVGLYLLIGVGLIGHENMQIEGFWYFLALGVFEGATIHYLVAKIAGPLVFGRGWCGYACWTAMVLDVLPYKTRQAPRKKWEWARTVMLAASIAFVVIVLTIADENADNIIFAAFIAGNIAYYVAGIALAFALKDNRAFCKYLCPVGLLMKPTASLSLIRIRFDAEKCIGCGACTRACPMDVQANADFSQRARKTECILCAECIKACPTKALTF